jgi:hypothetical protein
MVTPAVQMLPRQPHLHARFFLSHQQVIEIVRCYLRIAFFLFAPMLVLGACQDAAFGRLDPQMAVDSAITIAAPQAAQTGLPMPSALDVTASGGIIRGGRFPERVQDANLGWDVAVRVRDGQLVFIGSTGLGNPNRAGITPPLAGVTLQTLRDIPGGVSFETTNPVPVQVGAVYAVRSREFSTGFGACLQYAKLQVVQADVTTGRVSMHVETNERCYDTRLVAAGS